MDELTSGAAPDGFPSRSTPSYKHSAFLQPVPECNRIVAGLVARGIEQRNGPGSGEQARGDAACRLALQLAMIFRNKAFPLRWIGMHAPTQGVARRNVLEPKIDPRFLL